jgi:hypothetical protein
LERTKLMVKKSTKPSLKIVSSSPTTGQQPPRKLGQHGLNLWRTVTSEYNITDAGGIEILMQVCRATDRVEALATQIDEEGETITVKGVPKSHPLLRDEIQIRAFICRGLQKLGLNVEAIKPIGRPGGY